MQEKNKKIVMKPTTSKRIFITSIHHFKSMAEIIDQAKHYMLSFFAQSQNRHLIQRHRTSISAAVALLGVYMLIKSITRIPRQLAHLPHLGFFEYMGAIVKRKTLADIASRLTLPVASQSDSGMYAVSRTLHSKSTSHLTSVSPFHNQRFDRDGWTVHITQPAAAKKFLLKTGTFIVHTFYMHMCCNYSYCLVNYRYLSQSRSYTTFENTSWSFYWHP